MDLSSPIESIKGIGPKKADYFHKLGIFRMEDILYYYPRAYEDQRYVKKSCECINNEKALLAGRVLICNFGRGYGRKRTLHILCEDSTGRFEVIFFMAGYMKNAFAVGREYSFFGKVKVENGRITLFHPEFREYDPYSAAIMPIYPLTKGLSQKDMRKVSKTALSLTKNHLTETLPDSVIESEGLCDNVFALNNIHYPENESSYSEAKYRLVYEELFCLKTALMLMDGKHRNIGTSIYSGKAADFIKTLPYELTGAQKRTLEEILNDMRSQKAMNRLVQGDVGSGKTVVAAAALFEAACAGFQGLLMAPTDILAEQHFETLKNLFKPFNISIALLTASVPSAKRKKVLEGLENGDVQVAVGTVALISDFVIYKNAGLVVTDEQHRFGVAQREKLTAKGNDPDVLVMTATPIPRTLAAVLYGGFDFSSIDELPPGRRPIRTMSFKENDRKEAYKLLLGEINKGRQAYIVAPFIEDSESINGHSAEGLFEAFRIKHPEISCGLLHGDMSSEEKDAVMNKFKNGALSVLISTVIIEVGIDVPNATVMLIENSERFGLAQMHQLRGRVGRGSEESYCLICTGEESEISSERTKILCETNNGFIIAEKDLKIRGPGEFFGYRQHGLPQLVLADVARHADIAEKAGLAAKKLLSEDPDLCGISNKPFAESVRKKYMQVENLTL